MGKLNLTGKVTITTFTTIEADTLEEAIEKANKRQAMMSIVSNGGDTPDDVWMVQDLDGIPFDIEIEE